jgi:hypothetical protein
LLLLLLIAACYCYPAAVDDLVEVIVHQGAVEAVVPLLSIGDKTDPQVQAR